MRRENNFPVEMMGLGGICVKRKDHHQIQFEQAHFIKDIHPRVVLQEEFHEGVVTLLTRNQQRGPSILNNKTYVWTKMGAQKRSFDSEHTKSALAVFCVGVAISLENLVHSWNFFVWFFSWKRKQANLLRYLRMRFYRKGATCLEILVKAGSKLLS